jgi:aminopeptidase YwaD
VFQWSGIPYDDTLKSFGFKAPYRVAARLRQALAAGPVTVKVEVDAAFYLGPVRTVVAEIPGVSRPDERIVLVAHIQEPGANDDASGCGTLAELARAFAGAVAAGGVPPPERTLTFIWGDEIRASRQWLKDHAAEVGGVQYMFSLDMTGEDVTKTGGSFLIEKQPDPSAVWDRPSDPHTEWGRGNVKVESLKGSLLNDLHLAVCARRALDTGWIVKTNPYEGGSDHSVFLQAGVPSLLDWHFTDRYYHTNLDRPDKTSAAEMKHVGIAVGVSAWWLASANEAEAVAVADLVARAAEARLALERRQGQALIASATDRASAEQTERTVFDAWKKWYVEALDSVLRLPGGAPSEALQRRVANAVERVNQLR